MNVSMVVSVKSSVCHLYSDVLGPIGPSRIHFVRFSWNMESFLCRKTSVYFKYHGMFFRMRILGITRMIFCI